MNSSDHYKAFCFTELKSASSELVQLPSCPFPSPNLCLLLIPHNKASGSFSLLERKQKQIGTRVTGPYSF